MAKALRWFGYAVGALLVLLLLAATWLWFASSRAMGGTYDGVPENLPAPTATQLADAPRQLKILGCVSCHGDGLRGHLMFNEPGIAKVYAPNLTLLAAKASDQQLARAIRQGIGTDGRPLFIMPSGQFARLEDGEVAALIHAIRAFPSGGRQTPPISVGPLGRIGLVTGKFRSQVEEVERFGLNMPVELGAQFAKGRKLAMVNCAECHGPSFEGAEAKPGLKAPDLAIAGAYDLEQFRTLLRTGVPADRRKLELMDVVSRNDFAHYSDEEIASLHAYLVERANRAQ